MRADALAVMAKAPIPGQVKTRLVPPLSPEEAAAISRSLLLDLLDALSGFDGADLFVAFTPKEEARLFRQMAPAGFSCFPQRGEGLGQRMDHIFEDLFREGYERVVVVGSDLPVFPLKILEEAFESLARPELDLVLGPSRDGGYYLIGMKRPIPELFRDIPWGGPQVFSMTAKRASELALRWAFLPSWFDIDTPEDLDALASMDDPSLRSAQSRTLERLNRLKKSK